MKSTDKMLTCHFHSLAYALHYQCKSCPDTNHSTSSTDSVDASSCPKEGSSMESLADIVEALEYASHTRLTVDEMYKNSVDDFINKLLDAKLEAVNA